MIFREGLFVTWAGQWLWRILKDLEGYWKILKDIEGYWRNMKDLEWSWRILKDLEDLEGSSWILQDFEGSSWIFKDFVGSWRVLDVEGLPNCIGAWFLKNVPDWLTDWLSEWLTGPDLERLAPLKTYFTGLVVYRQDFPWQGKAGQYLLDHLPSNNCAQFILVYT